MATACDLLAVSRIVNALWRLWLQAGSSSAPRLVPAALPPEFVAGLPTPTTDALPDGQPVALVDGERFDRSTDAAMQQAKHETEPRTRLYEGVDVLDCWWFRPVALQLSHLTGFPVTASVYESNAEDAGLLPHTDAWTGMVLQLRGLKEWNFFTPPNQVLQLSPGDALLVPTSAQHHVRTPSISVHVVFEVMTESGL